MKKLKPDTYAPPTPEEIREKEIAGYKDQIRNLEQLLRISRAKSEALAGAIAVITATLCGRNNPNVIDD